MKKEYNKFTTGDIPMDASLDPSGPKSKATSKTTTKPTIQAIGSKAKAASGKTTSSKAKTATSGATKGSVRQKLTKDSIDLKDLEKLNEENIKSHSFRSKRNQVIIVLLSIFLVLAIAFIVVYAVLTKEENNCFLYVDGNASATYVVNGDELTEFRSPENLQNACLFHMNLELKIHEPGEYEVKFIILCYADNQLLTKVDVFEPNTKEGGFTLKEDGYYHSKTTIKGGTTVKMCEGVMLNEYGVDVDADNFKMEVRTHITKVSA